MYRKVSCAWYLALLLVLPAKSQFKEIGPPPFSPAIAHQKIKQLLASVNPGNRKQTVATLYGWVAWYRDVLDEELVAAWRQDSRANLPEVIEALGDARVASDVVAFCWRESRPTTVNLNYAPMLANLMSRYPRSSEPFLQDLLGQKPTLSTTEAEGVCRILLDMPDLGTWREDALQILPRYPEVAKGLLTQDLHASDEEKSYRAERWMADLKMSSPAAEPTQQSRHRTMPPGTTANARAEAPRRIHVDGPPVPIETEPKQPHSALPPFPLPQATQREATQPEAAVLPAAVPSAAVPQASPLYDGPKSGTYESAGGPIPQNAEFVFRNVPLVKMHLDYDSKIWDTRFSPGDGKTQRLIVRNKSGSPQKRCLVRWSIAQ